MDVMNNLHLRRESSEPTPESDQLRELRERYDFERMLEAEHGREFGTRDPNTPR